MFDWKLSKRVSPPMVLLMIRWLVALKCFGFDELEDVQGLTYIYIYIIYTAIHSIGNDSTC